jgi:hypothetical protein
MRETSRKEAACITSHKTKLFIVILSCLFLAGLSLGLFFYLEHWGSMCLRTSIYVHRTTWRYILKDRTLHFNIILPFTPGFLHSDFPTKILYAFFTSPMRGLTWWYIVVVRRTHAIYNWIGLIFRITGILGFVRQPLSGTEHCVKELNVFPSSYEGAGMHIYRI